MVLRVSLQVSLNHVLLASEVAYIELAASVRLDTSGFFRFVPETVVTQDGLRYSFSKALADAQPVPDSVSILSNKALAHSFSLADTTVRQFGKSLQDAPTVGDLLAQAVSKVLPPDTYHVSDLVSLEPQKGLASSVSLPSDFTTRMTFKVLGDSVTMLDEFERLLLTIRNRDDDQPVTDQTIITAIKPFVDSFEVSDDQTITVTKVFADGFAMNDSADAGDGSTYSFSKGVSNVAFVGDAAAKSFSTSFADSFGSADSGLVSAQNYADPSYFAEDYVGVSTTF